MLATDAIAFIEADIAITAFHAAITLFAAARYFRHFDASHCHCSISLSLFAFHIAIFTPLPPLASVIFAVFSIFSRMPFRPPAFTPPDTLLSPPLSLISFH
jgi:hypothetical protein